MGIKAKLDDKELSWLPYKVGDTLIFTSSGGVFDTSYIIENKVWYSPYNPVEQHGKYHPQIGQVTYRNAKLFNLNKEEELVIVTKENPNEPASKAIAYYNSYFFNEDKYDTLKGTLFIQGVMYSDLWLISKRDSLGRPNKPEQINLMPKILYWSKSKGLVKYITYSEDVWELKARLHRE
jgi:hypothetical protein